MSAGSWLPTGPVRPSHLEKDPPPLPSPPAWAGAPDSAWFPRHQQQPDGSLVISHVAVEDGGFYACVAFNGQDREQRWVQLRVQGEGQGGWDGG